MDERILTTSHAGKRLGVSVPRIHQLISDGRLKAEKFGSVYIIRESDLDNVKILVTGRPPKVKQKPVKSGKKTTRRRTKK
jgi:excisionase family DNA binding protein